MTRDVLEGIGTLAASCFHVIAKGMGKSHMLAAWL